jgi:endonuclease/exonuclease/phosphatase family metal-dependent hydrolase
VSAGCWLLVLPGLVWAVVRAAGAERGVLVQLIAFTPYVAAWTLVPVAVALVLRRWPAAVVAGLVALAFGIVVLPRALPAGGPTAEGPQIRVLTANLLAGSADPAAVVRLVRDRRVDVLALQELTPQARHDLDRHGLVGLLPYRQVTPEAGTTGSGLYARFPIGDAGTRRNEGGFNHAYGSVVVPGSVRVRVESAHPAAPYALSALPWWWTDLRAQPPATPDGEVRILAGDFNATLDHAPLRALLATGYVDAAEVAGAGLTGTWGPYDGDPIPPVAIDHVLCDRRIGVADVSVHPLPGSDHRAVLAELRLPAPQSGGRLLG